MKTKKFITFITALILSIVMTTSAFASGISAISTYDNERLQYIHRLLELNGVERQRVATADIPAGVHVRTFDSMEEYMDYLELVATSAAFQTDNSPIFVDGGQTARSFHGGGTWTVDTRTAPWFLGGGMIHLTISVMWSGGRITGYSSAVVRNGLHISNLHVNSNTASLVLGGNAVMATAVGSFAEFILIPGTPITEVFHHPWTMSGTLHVFEN